MPERDPSFRAREALMPVYFSAVEGAMLLGRRVRSLRAFSGLEEGTEGVVVATWSAPSGEGVGIDVEWSIRGGLPLVDGFSADEYRDCLVEV